ncbi:hypothetical protein [Undibacterium sp. Xuan67W]|uniref:hypothetical protein n=1 Tax=Undibacterium sp. Xuan67W TaxID=3413057 RepID=UPI003BF3DE50
MEIKHCVTCGQVFQPRPQVPQQCYCSAKECQRERRRRWQRDKLKHDPDYQDNQARAQQAWSNRNSNYWREYREAHPEYVDRNRTQQRERNQRPQNAAIAKMDVSIPVIPLPSGIYRLHLIVPNEIAKMDVWTVEITAHACQCVPHVEIAKRGRVP